MSDSRNNFFSNYGRLQKENLEEIKEDAARIAWEAPSYSLGNRDDTSVLHYELATAFRPPEQSGSSARAIKKAQERRKKLIIGGIAAVVILGVIIWLIVSLVTSGIRVMNFYDWKLTDVQLWASQNEINLQIEREYNDEIEANKVISQSIGQDKIIKKGDFLGILVSLGHDPSVIVPLPDLMNMTGAEIEKWFTDNYMTKVRITTENSATIPTGRVIRYEINDNTIITEVRRDTPIYIIVSKGPKISAAAVIPDLRGKTQAECEEFAKVNGIKLDIIKEHHDTVPQGMVIRQSVAANETLPAGATLQIVISSGREIIVPYFYGLTRAQAMARATEAGISPIVEETFSTAAKGVLIYQSVSAGEVLRPGDLLTLFFSLGSTIPLGSYVGQMPSSLETWAGSHNEQGASIKISYTYTQNDAPAGTIIFQDPVNVSIYYQTTISVVVSQGFTVYVPDFVVARSTTATSYADVITQQTALDMCKILGLIPIFAQRTDSNRLPGEICGQSIEAGREVKQGSTIVLYYYPDVSVTVPQFIAMSKTNVDLYLSDFKIVYTFDDPTLTPAQRDNCVVYAQSISAGLNVSRGSTITLSLREP